MSQAGRPDYVPISPFCSDVQRIATPSERGMSWAGWCGCDRRWEGSRRLLLAGDGPERSLRRVTGFGVAVTMLADVARGGAGVRPAGPRRGRTVAIAGHSGHRRRQGVLMSMFTARPERSPTQRDSPCRQGKVAVTVNSGGSLPVRAVTVARGRSPRPASLGHGDLARGAHVPTGGSGAWLYSGRTDSAGRRWWSQR